MHTLSPDQIEACCSLVNTRMEETRDGQRGPLAFRDAGKLEEIIRNLCQGQLRGYIEERRLAEEFVKWRRKQNVAETFGEGEHEERGSLDDIAISETAEESREAATTLARLIPFIGEESLFSRKVIRKRAARTLKPGETALTTEGPGNAVIRGEAYEWLQCATLIYSPAGTVDAILPDHRFICIHGGRVYMWRFTVNMTERDAFRVIAKLSALIALFQGGISKQTAEKKGISRALFSYHQRNFAKRTLKNGGVSNFHRLKNLKSAG